MCILRNADGNYRSGLAKPGQVVRATITAIDNGLTVFIWLCCEGGFALCRQATEIPETLVNCVAPGLLDRTRATANLRSEQIERSASGSLLNRPADKDDCADMVVAMCRTETLTGQTVVIDSGRISTRRRA
jgi:hypothetical protein